MGRLRLVFTLLMLSFGIIGARLFYWQIVNNDSLVAAASSQYFFTLDIPAQRGLIVTHDGSPLAINKTAYLAYAEPKNIKNKDQFAEYVSEQLELDKEQLVPRLADQNILWVLLKHKVEEATVSVLKESKLEGIGFEPEGKRYYPEASMAAHLLGFVGSDATGGDKGYFGLEGFYNLALRGKPGSLIQEKDALGLPILVGGSKRISTQNGHTLKLHLDKTVQFTLEENLKKGIERYGAKEGLVVAMDPKTGGILGSAAFPQYDPNSFRSFEDTLYANPLVAHTYEPGSTFKALVMAAALSERVVEPSTKFNEEGPLPVSNYQIRTWNNEYHGEITATQILERSSNPGMVFIQKKLGRDTFIEYLTKFGFGEKTGIDLEEEESAELRGREEWKEIDLATASFGQGIAVTPVQMIRAIGAIANGGTLMEPHIVQQIIDDTGREIDIKPKKVRQVIRPSAAKAVTEMMISAVDNGEAKWAKPAGYRIAGKTGTAQIPVAGHYDAEKTIASFVGFAPADNPKFVMLVLLREPSTSPWGSETAAPLFFTIARELFAYYGISPRD